MRKTMYDVVVIGSSPVAIFQAIKSARHGLKTVIIEKDQNVGGAWKTRQVYGIGQTESACHLIEFYAGVYETLSDLIGIDFIKLGFLSLPGTVFCSSSWALL